MEPRKPKNPETMLRLTARSYKELLLISGIVVGIIVGVVLVVFIAGPLFNAICELLAECFKSIRSAIGGI
jgi:F0F1-type ATP synthase assembly protein I